MNHVRVAVFCSAHAEHGMVNVLSKLCAYEGCTLHPNFGVEGSRLPIFCSEHALDGYVNVAKRK